MSAVVVGHAHIDALLTFASDNRVSYWNGEERVSIRGEENAIGCILLQENERSVRYRYDDAGDDLPGTIGETWKDYEFRVYSEPLTPVAILKGCNCYDYQACETDNYDQSEAYRIINAIRQAAIRKLPGYDDAPGWEFRPRRRARAA